MKKNLTISIAAYNVENYLEKTLDSLIIDNLDKLEVLIVNDGSKDNTKKIAQKYCKKYPKSFKLIDKKNGGYGSTINAGIKEATGKYFKQLDGDDWYNTDNLNKLVEDIEKIDSDVIYTPFITYYEKDGKEEINSNSITNNSNENIEIEKIISDSSILFMHNLAYNTKLLKENKISIDEHCFYTDTEYVALPFMCAKTIYILDYPVYMYRVGREGQSVSVSGRKKHWQEHQRVSYTLMDFYKKQAKKMNKNKKEYYEKYLASIFASGIGNYLLTLEPNKENFELIKKYDNDIKMVSKKVYDLMPNYSKAVSTIRKNNYFLYKLLVNYKKIMWRIK